MKISTKGRYGLRAMVDMAIHCAGEHISIKNVSERQGISENYLEQVFSILRKAGLVRSIKGAQGGYILSTHPSEITVGRILRVMEGNLEIVDSVAETVEGKNRLENTIKTLVWDRLNQSINQLADSLTLEELVEHYRKNNNKDSFTYYI
ncbi:MAG: Rrf2 family transcriptional regulator [Clostridia bacterium]|nr:Rrf2 family transcriptional regulator [Clostridia bacterium]